MKIIQCQVMGLIVLLCLLGCSERVFELSNIRAETIDRLTARGLIPDDQRFPANVQQSESIRMVTFNYHKTTLENLQKEGDNG